MLIVFDDAELKVQFGGFLLVLRNRTLPVQVILELRCMFHTSRTSHRDYSLCLPLNRFISAQAPEVGSRFVIVGATWMFLRFVTM